MAARDSATRTSRLERAARDRVTRTSRLATQSTGLQ
jgi:hypothetical protein